MRSRSFYGNILKVTPKEKSTEERVALAGYMDHKKVPVLKDVHLDAYRGKTCEGK